MVAQLKKVVDAGLDLSGPSLTIFAPNDNAWKEFDDKKKPSPAELKKILQFHVFDTKSASTPKVLYSTVLAGDIGKDITSVNDFNTKVRCSVAQYSAPPRVVPRQITQGADGSLKFGDATVVTANVLTSSGVGELTPRVPLGSDTGCTVHVIDKVITEASAPSSGKSSKKLKWWGIILIILAIFFVLFVGWKLYQRFVVPRTYRRLHSDSTWQITSQQSSPHYSWNFIPGR